MSLFSHWDEDAIKQEILDDLPIGGGSLSGEYYEECCNKLDQLKDEGVDLSEVRTSDLRRLVEED